MESEYILFCSNIFYTEDSGKGRWKWTQQSLKRDRFRCTVCKHANESMWWLNSLPWVLPTATTFTMPEVILLEDKTHNFFLIETIGKQQKPISRTAGSQPWKEWSVKMLQYSFGTRHLITRSPCLCDL